MKRLLLLAALLSIPPVFAMQERKKLHRTITIHIENTSRHTLLCDPRPVTIEVNGEIKRCSVEGCKNDATMILYTSSAGLLIAYCEDHKHGELDV